MAATFWLERVSGWVWGPLLLFLLMGTGLLLTVRLGGLQFRGLRHALKLVGRKGPGGEGDISPFQALTTALAGTIGTGNIAGVATAVVVGGLGSLFWMWIAGLIGMALTYGEAVLSVHFRTRNAEGRMAGGPMYTLERGLGWRWLGICYALFGLLATLGVGSTVQVHSIADIMASQFSVPPIWTGLCLVVFVGMVVIGGVQSIGRVTMVVVPMMACFYLLGGLIVIALNWHAIPTAIGLIVKGAFSGRAVGGGAIGWLLALRMGVARGTFSNEAGLGSSSIAAAAAQTDSAPRQALITMTGTFFDTIIVCSITGLVLAVSGVVGTSSLNGAPLTAAAFQAHLPGGGLIVAVGLALFAYSTILAWAYYGEKCLEYLAGTRSQLIFRLAFVFVVFFGAVLPLDAVWFFADVANGLMAIPNLVAILALNGLIATLTRTYWENRVA